ncbi:MAG TPA: nitroreductase family protein [Candidatus Limnocylindrales bacterium]|nr:nitroreductase family protein [Candidatus Limnocylindrales bacterium]
MSDSSESQPRDAVRPLVRVRQIREYTPERPTDAELAAIADAARWSGSSSNEQPWRFILIRDRDVLGRLTEAGLPQTRTLRTAPAAIATAVRRDDREVSRAYDEGRVVERILIAANLVGLAAGIAWITRDVAPLASELLGLPADWFVRTVVAIGHPTEAALRPKSEVGKGRLPKDQVVFEERWPTD